MTFLRCAFLACFLCSSWGLKTIAQSCDPNDSLALKEFAGNLTNGSIITSWSNKSTSCQWDGVVCGSNINGSIHRRVTMLILSKKGGLPSELSSLKWMEVLDLSHNLLSGPVSGVLSGLISIQSLNISSNLFKEDLFELGGYPNLVVFNISNNSFSGPVTSQICSSSKGIQILDLSMNHLVGNLAGLYNCSKSLQQLHLGSNSLSGSLPDFIYSTLALQHFSISNNNFSGRLSKELSKLSSLKTLVIYGNQFSGHIPDAFGNLTHLEHFDAHSNMLSGPLPSTLSFCSKLHILDLRNNSLTGPVDLNFTGMPGLCTLDLAANHFSGPLPNSLSDCRGLETLSLAKNELTGKIPESFAKLSSLLFLSLSNNSFVDLSGALDVLQHCQNLSTLILTKNFVGEEIPRNVSGFQNLMVLAFGNCALKGHIPSWLLRCRKLEVLDLSWNHLGGSIPSWIGQMESLFYLDFSNNSLTGEIPTSLTDLKSLISANSSSPHLTASAGIPLYVKRNQSASGLPYKQASSFPPSILLSNNRINGTIPPEVGRLKDLHVLDLSRNNITGTIPDSFSQMENLEILDFSSNNLYGSIPSSLEKLNSVKFRLCGVIISPCNAINGTRKPGIPSGSESRFRRSNVLSIIITIGVGFALVIAIVLHKMSRRNLGVVSDDLEEEGSLPHRLSEALRSSKLVLFQNSDCKDLTVADLLKSTNNFNQENIIGCGGFGLVYKANLPNDRKAAIKRLSGDCGQMEREFQAEVEALSRAQHKNLVPLQGYCRHVCEPHIVHRDVKSSNILLDENFEAHLADFGLSRLLRPYDTHVTTDLVGTLGYIPPEYSQTLMATCRGDVYSFGVVLLELLTGRRPVEVCKGKNCRDLVSWAFQMKSEKREAEIIDSAIWDKDHQKQLFEMLEIACRCLDQDPRRRPLIEEVVSWLVLDSKVLDNEL
uniref:non-specific serine/threonine protein kinase n=1 Tax=Salix viminalis TaxID=40686 RepID=A0A6N2NM55_SALVM